MVTGEIGAKIANKEDKTERETSPVIIHLGVFFDGSSPKLCKSSSLASYYNPPNDESHKRLTITIGPCESPTIEQQFDIDKLEDFSDIIGEILYTVFDRANKLLSVYFINADCVTIEIDTFCVEDGFLTASLFCEAIEPGCYNKKPFYAERALADLTGGIFEDLRTRGAKIKLNSFTTFQLPPEENKQNFIKKRSSSKNSANSEKESPSKRELSDWSASGKSNYEYIRSNEDYSQWYIQIKGAKYEGLYSNLCTAKEWLENTAVACDIVAISTSLTGIGLPAGAVAEVVSMGLSGIAAVTCFTLAAMDTINGDEESRKEHMADVGWNTAGAIPFGSILAKAGKGVKFSTKVSSVPLKSINNVDPFEKVTSHADNVVDMFPTKPNLNIIDGGKSASETVQATTTAIGETTSSAHLRVIQGGKTQEKIIKQVNGPDIVIAGVNDTKKFVVLDSIENFRPINYLNISQSTQVSINAGSHIISNSAQRVSKNDSIFTKTKSSEYPEPIKPVDAVENIPPVDNNVVAMSGDSSRLKNISNRLEYELEYFAMLNKRFIQTVCKNKNINIE